ncbi:MAG TPA: hypothetical protein VFW40_04420 [Capsulimonadaceae bacterium]|nr:hypothetical protein [Capsulimonadaceae bacterium]
MQRQADIHIHPDLAKDSQIGLEWKLCDNGFPVDQGKAVYVLDSGSIDWRGHRPPEEDESLVRELILERVQSFLAGG